ncbi:hypothetical protein CAEBREN_06382 [Caenorhabditis brenneri]|uniref:Uncharacterized protein n=1 Tax=Caenorhabditis brenneri TaxID=135651 RepID=G0MQK9_CAEBE|nr:hypothetical protein CAEBREN_06382 [Caenorhabditis brenneri]
MVAHSNNILNYKLPRRGYLIGMTPRQITLFDQRTFRIFKLPAADNTNLVLGRFYEVDNYVFTESIPDNRVNFYVKRGVVAVDAYVVSPDQALLPQEIYNKFEGSMWSDQIGFCKDRFGFYWKNAKRGEKLFVTIQFMLGNFQICEPIQNPGNPREYKMNPSTPWDAETFDTIGIEYSLHPTPADEYVQLHNRLRGPGICVSENVTNVNYRGHKKSKELCHELFYPKLGLVRYFPSDSDIRRLPRQDESDLGRWFYFRAMQQRNRRFQIQRYETLTATSRVEVFPPLETVVNQREITIVTSFVFNQNILESPENRRINDQQLRFQNLSDNAHFIDEVLGRVVISKEHAQRMIELYERYMRYRPARVDQHKNENLLIKAAVRIRPDYREFTMNHPGQGIFFMVHLDQMIFEESRITLYGLLEG